MYDSIFHSWAEGLNIGYLTAEYMDGNFYDSVFRSFCSNSDSVWPNRQGRTVMNRTQKGAWFTFGVAILLLTFGLIIFTQMFADGAASIALVRIWLLVILFFMGISAVLLRIKQSRAEVDFDERDNSIKKNAVLVSFASFCTLLFAAGIIPSFVAGDEGSIPVCLLPIINLGVFLIVMLVYSAAILVQYGWGIKEKNHE